MAAMTLIERDLAERVRRCRRRVTARALIAAGAAVVPVPGLDIAVDVQMLLRLIDEINAEFGLSLAQIEQLAPRRKLFAYRAISVVGSTLIGRVLTRDLLITVLKQVGVRLTAAAAAKWLPMAGQAVAAGLSFTALKYLGERHIADCVRVAELLARR